MISLVSESAQTTADLGCKIGTHLSTLTNGFAIALTGDLGTGKTCFVQGLAQGLMVDQGYYITSPTFNIINEYPARSKRLVHMDLYRLSDAEELEYLGIEDLLGEDAVLAVEWPVFLEETGFKFDLELRFEFDKDFNRVISIFPSGQHGTNLLSSLIL
ncbi:MAG: tRNA (adenosine(37)-N6)-threonylcarbamoyltransferase complex ATPase subunit type 1 TsaE [Desulfobacter sp.]|nr:tRNA (adenosine(37)-N6)-threonylcarbamoyltransferase complex ATPase subunit type 1 TsaE [Desulfobacter sp.]WDP87131.1 MAG: tRNA (adenosine(37)-N6)-threonylcarbamoyltransferase complex ATPase subunit type 1 TsaE [Desulfobacter sp.]